MKLDGEAIESLIQKAKTLNLTGLRVAEGENEFAIDFPRRAAVPATQHPVVVTATTLHEVVSRLVGYFRPSVDIGTQVEKGTAIGVIESLGLQNDVPAPAAGRVIEFFAADGDAVEYGTLLARIKP
ncbi:MAG: hypothetical protein M3R13_10455 [Armatimonadota bacterium]|nr:hypothetical protein [Armatimonadota bacterium]